MFISACDIRNVARRFIAEVNSRIYQSVCDTARIKFMGNSFSYLIEENIIRLFTLNLHKINAYSTSAN